MKVLIEEVNEKLKGIINDLENQKNDVEKSLENVQEKIDSKIDEAKEYKITVDSAKDEIKRIEDEISNLENDLKDLTIRFSGKELDAILETGNKEINNKIIERQKEITKQRDKISEYTEKARTIKDLLINLKKDKESKKYKLDNLAETFTYYEKELTKIMNFANDNPDNLNEKEKEVINLTEEDIKERYNFKNEPIVDDKPIFDAIESIEKENEEGSEDYYDEEYTTSLDDNHENNINDKDEKNEPVVEDLEQKADNILNEFNLFEEANEEPQNDDKNIENKEPNIDFKTLNETIDKEYESIFGSSNDININTPEVNVEPTIPVTPVVPTPPVNTLDTVNLFGINNHSGSIFDDNFLNEINKEESTAIETEDNTPKDIETFFKNNNLDFTKFSLEDQTKLRNNYDLINYTKTLDILRKNNIDINNVYNAVNIFNVNHNELESIINKLLIAGQNTKNISYVLNTLSLIKSIDLQDVIDSYGSSIKDANITDLIIKAKHLNEIGGGR